MEAALSRPPALLERAVLLLTPPGAREAVLGDLCETYRCPSQYASDALRTLPFVIASQVRRNANLPVLGLQGFLMCFCLDGFAGRGSPAAHAAFLTIAALPALAVREAYRAGERQSSRRAMGEAVLVALALLLFCQSLSFGMMGATHQSDQVSWLQLGFTAPLMFPLFCLFRASLLDRGGDPAALPAECLSEEVVRRDYGRFAQRTRRHDFAQSAALAVCALLLPRLDLLGGRTGPALACIYGLTAVYLLCEGAVRRLPAQAGLLSLRALYRHELARRQQLRRFLCWLWFAPALILLQIRLVETGFAAGRSIMIAYGVIAIVLLCFFLNALNREQDGRVREKIDRLDREDCAPECA
jgi:hypothetical protein